MDDFNGNMRNLKHTLCVCNSKQRTRIERNYFTSTSNFHKEHDTAKLGQTTTFALRLIFTFCNVYCENGISILCFSVYKNRLPIWRRLERIATQLRHASLYFHSDVCCLYYFFSCYIWVNITLILPDMKWACRPCAPQSGRMGNVHMRWESWQEPWGMR